MTDQPTRPLNLADIEARANAERLTPGPWTLDREQCDCSDGYCHHGQYVTSVVTTVPTEIAAERCKRTGEQPRDYDFHRSEIGDFSEADWELMVHARTDVPALLAEIRRLQAQRKYLLGQLAKKDAESGRGDAALREFLAAHPDEVEMAASMRRDGFGPDEIVDMLSSPPAASAAGESGSTR